MRKLALHWWIVIALVAGVVVGACINVWWTPETWRSLGVGDARAFLAGKASEADPGANAQAGAGAVLVRFVARLNQFAGDIFLKLLRFVAVPIVLFSLVVGVASLGDPRKLGRIGGKTIGLFVITTAISAAIGLTVSNAVKPGTFVSEEKRESLARQFEASAQSKIQAGETVKKTLSVWDEIVKVVPQNPFAALASAEMLQIVFFACAVGLALTLIPKSKAAPAVAACDGIQEALSALIRVIMYAAPFAVFALIASTAAQMGLDVLGALAVYCVVAVVGLAISLFAMYPALLWLLTPRGNKVGFARFFRAMAPAQLLAFSSSSSSATLPVTMECTHKRLGVSEEITSFACPLGATVNMGGTALYQAVASTFIAQLFGIDLSLTQQATIVGLATLIAVGSPGVPGGSIVMMVIVLEAIHVPAAGIAVILSVDRILDMCRTVVNISGDAAVAAVVAGSEGQLASEPVASRE